MATMNFFPPTHLILLPDVIDGPGEYKTRSGETVTIETFNPGPSCRIRAFGFYHIPTKIKESWYSSGRVHGGIECANDIVSKAGV